MEMLPCKQTYLNEEGKFSPQGTLSKECVLFAVILPVEEEILSQLNAIEESKLET